MDGNRPALGAQVDMGLGPLPLWRDDGGRSWWGADELTGDHIQARIAAEVAAERERIKARLMGMNDAAAGRHNYYDHAAWVLFGRA